MDYTTEIVKLKEIYKPTESILLDYILPFLIIFIFLICILIMFIRVQLLQQATVWTKEQCVPKYMFMSGIIAQNPGSGMLKTTYDNFVSCITEYRLPRNKHSPYTHLNVSPIHDNHTAGNQEYNLLSQFNIASL